MRTFKAALVASAAVAAMLVLTSARTAAAEDIAGTYDAKFEEVANNCSAVGVGMGLSKNKLRIRKGKKDQVSVDIERIPVMTGTVGKAGSLRAASKLGPTSIEKLDGKFSVAGQVADTELSLVLVAEYFDRGNALCSQTWNVTGTREAAAKAPAKAPAGAAR